MYLSDVSAEYLGLPCATATDLYSSPLVHCDVVTFLTVGDKAETKQMHKEFKGAIKANESISIMCGFKYMSKGKNFVSIPTLIVRFPDQPSILRAERTTLRISSV